MNTPVEKWKKLWKTPQTLINTMELCGNPCGKCGKLFVLCFAICTKSIILLNRQRICQMVQISFSMTV